MGGVWGGEAPPGISVTRALPPEFLKRTNFVRVRNSYAYEFGTRTKFVRAAASAAAVAAAGVAAAGAVAAVATAAVSSARQRHRTKNSRFVRTLGKRKKQNKSEKSMKIHEDIDFGGARQKRMAHSNSTRKT